MGAWGRVVPAEDRNGVENEHASPGLPVPWAPVRTLTVWEHDLQLVLRQTGQNIY